MLQHASEDHIKTSEGCKGPFSRGRMGQSGDMPVPCLCFWLSLFYSPTAHIRSHHCVSPWPLHIRQERALQETGEDPGGNFVAPAMRARPVSAPRLSSPSAISAGFPAGGGYCAGHGAAASVPVHRWKRIYTEAGPWKAVCRVHSPRPPNGGAVGSGNGARSRRARLGAPLPAPGGACGGCNASGLNRPLDYYYYYCFRF